MTPPAQRRRGQASRRFTRQPTTGQAHDKRVAWGHKWGQAIRAALIREGVLKP